MLCFCLNIACIVFGVKRKFYLKRNELKQKYKYITKNSSKKYTISNLFKRSSHNVIWQVLNFIAKWTDSFNNCWRFCRSNTDGSYRSLISQHNGVVSCSILYGGGCHWRCSRHISRTIILSWIEVFQINKWPRGASIDTQFALFTAASIAHYLEKAVLRFWTGYLTCLLCIKPVVGNLSFLPWKRLLNAFSNVVVGKICSVNVRVVMPTDHSNFVTHCVSSKLILRDCNLPLMICVKLLSLVLNNVPHCDR